MYRLPVRIALTLLLALGCAGLCLWLRTPLPWMLGPLIGTAVLTILGAPTANSLVLRQSAQLTIGCALGLYFTPQTGALIVSLWWAILLASIWALVLGLVFGVLLLRVNRTAMPGLTLTTTYFASAAGGVTEMTLLAERYGGRADLVAAAHSMRMLIVTIVIPFGVQFSGLHGVGVSPAARGDVQPLGLAVLMLASLGGVALARRLGGGNPWFLGALLASVAIHLTGTVLSPVPTALSNAAQLVLGAGLGSRFTREFVRAAPRWLFTVGLSCLGMVLVSAGFGTLLGWASGVHPVTMVLGTAPGGITEMAITAKVLQLGVPLVTALQACRLVAVLVLVEPMYRRHVVGRV